MAKYRKKPVIIDACLFDGNIRSIDDFPISEVGKFKLGSENGQYYLIIPTLEGDMKALPGDWIIKGVNGEYYPCKPDVFEKTYDVVESGVREQTFGEKAVGITFNPSGSDEVYEAKMLAAKQIDLLEKVHIKLTNDSANTSWVRNVLRTQAFNLLVSAQMALVKYITWKD